MNMIVCIKQILDPEIPARDFRIDSAAREAERGGANLVTNIFCENALETALQFREAHGGKITALSCGPDGAEDVLRKALALKADDAALIGEYLHEWSAPGKWPDEAAERHYRRAFQYRATAHCALEYHRWAIRSIPRPDGVRYVHRMEQPIIAPVLQIHGLSDGAVLPRSVDGSDEYVTGDYQRRDMPNVGHFPQEEDPEGFNEIVLDWLAAVSPTSQSATATSLRS